MTAWILRPESSAPATDDAVVDRFPYLNNSRREGNVFTAAVVVAMLVHLLAFWVPLPKRAALAPPEPPHVPTRLIAIPLPPPPPDAPRVVEIVQPEIKEPLPVPAPPDQLDPIVEQPVVLPEEPIAIDTDAFELIDPTEPTEAPVIHPDWVEESYAGLDVPVAISKPKPSYPRTAIAVRAEAEVVLEAIVDQQGNVTDVRLISVIGGVDLGFSEAAIDAVSRWVYAPGTIDGKPVAVRLTVRVAFNLR